MIGININRIKFDGKTSDLVEYRLLINMFIGVNVRKRVILILS